MKLPLYIVIILLAVTFVPACGPSAFDAEVARAEALMESAPDSALAIAESLRPDGRAEHARAALLLLKARYKAYVLLTDDSLARLAADHFDGDDSLAVQANFFLGDTYFNLNKYDKSLLAAKTGQHIAAKLGDKYYEGLLSRVQADVYRQCYDVGSELKYRRHAADCFFEAGKENHYIWERLYYAFAMAHSRDTKATKGILDAVAQDSAGQSVYFHADFSRAKALCHYLDDDYESTIADYARLDSLNILKTSYEWANLSQSLLEIGKLKEAKLALDSAEYLSTDRTDTVRILSVKESIALKSGNADEAYRISLQRNSVEYNYMDSLLTHPFNNLLAEAYHLRSESKANEVSRLKNKLVFTFTVAALFLVITILVYVLYKRTILLNKVKTENLLNELRSLKSTLDTSCEKLSQEKIEITRQRLEGINLICGEIFRVPSYAKETKKVLAKFEGIIEDFRAQKMQGFLEEFLNQEYEGVMRYLHAEFPSLSERQVILFTYCALEFSPEATALLTSTPSVNALGAAKSRLKKKFVDANTEHTTLFIKLLSSYKKRLQPEAEV